MFCARSRPTNKGNREQKPITKKLAEFHKPVRSINYVLAKNWKKNGRNSQTKGRGKNKEIKRRENYDTHVKELRRKISIAKAEMERLQENRKITKKGKKEQIGTAERMPNHFGGFSSKLHGKKKV